MQPELPTKIIAERIAAWHKSQQRSLPWRSTPPGERPAYAVWVSEIMAQQTRIATVIDYFERWMERFPTVHVLAAADQQEVLKLWEGLGYYSRARNLHRAAQMVVEEHQGQLPQTRTELLALPGIGAYTAGAILSLAYGKAEAILDGNIKRVLARVGDIQASIDERKTEKLLWTLSEDLVNARPAEAGIVNEGLMELGATLCLPRTPRCLLCPIQTECLAFARGTQNERPVRRARKTTPHYDVTAAVIWGGVPFASQLLIAQRPQDGMLGGLWEFPGGKMEEQDEDLGACLVREIQEELGVSIRVDEPIVRVDHTYTHFRITLYAFHAHLLEGTPRALGVADWRWIDFDALDEYPFPVTDRKVIAALASERSGQSGSGAPA